MNKKFLNKYFDDNSVKIIEEKIKSIDQITESQSFFSRIKNFMGIGDPLDYGPL